jgi:hypothetical protein
VTCQSCGTADVSVAASVASRNLHTLPEPMLDVLRENFFGNVPDELCAPCFLPTYSVALAAGATRLERTT